MTPLRLTMLAAIIAATPAAAAPVVEGAWVRLPAIAGRPAAGFLTVTGSGQADALVGATSPQAERIELHSMTMENGVMRMRAETSFAVPAGGKLQFAPGGNHLMLFGLAADVKAGDAIPITFNFQSGASLTVNAATRPAGAAATDRHDHH